MAMYGPKPNPIRPFRSSSDRANGGSIGGTPYSEQPASSGRNPSSHHGPSRYGHVNGEGLHMNRDVVMLDGRPDPIRGFAPSERGATNHHPDPTHRPPQFGSSVRAYAQSTQDQYRPDGNIHREPSPCSVSSRSRYPLSAALPSAPTTSSSLGNGQQQQQQQQYHNRSIGQGVAGRSSTDSSVPYPQAGLHDREASADPEDEHDPNGPIGRGRVTLPLLHLGSFSSLKLEDFALPQRSPVSPLGSSPGGRGRSSPSPMARQQTLGPVVQPNGRSSPNGTGVEYDPQRVQNGGLRPLVTTQDAYRSSSPSGSRPSPSESIAPSPAVVISADRLPNPYASVNGDIDEGPISGGSLAKKLIDGSLDDSERMTTAGAGIRSGEMFDTRDDRGMESGGGIVNAGNGDQTNGVPRSESTVVGQSRDKRQGSSRGTFAPQESHHPDIPSAGEHINGRDNLASPVRHNVDKNGNRDDHRQAVMRESTVNRRRTIIQDPAAPVGQVSDFGDPSVSARGQSLYEPGTRGLMVDSAGKRSRQASESAIGVGWETMPFVQGTASHQSVNGGRRRSSGQANVPPLTLQPRGSGIAEYGSMVSPAQEEEDEPSRLPYEVPEAPVAPSSDPRFKDAEATPTRSRILPSLPDGVGQSSAPLPLQNSSRDQDEGNALLAQSPGVLSSRPTGSSSRKVPPMGAVSLSQQVSSYGDNIPPGLEAIPGLLGEDGPYPSIARPQARHRAVSPAQIDRANQYQEISAVRSAGDARRMSSNVPQRVKMPPQAEEVCLECLMRDRDLIHVDVTTEGVWERASDCDFRDMLDQEKSIEERQKGGASEGQLDLHILEEVGWGGFVWEEGKDGWGLPPGFRGRLAGRLLEDRLKDQLLRFPSASSFRMKTLQRYLYEQSQLFEQHPTGWFPNDDDSASGSSKRKSGQSGGNAKHGLQPREREREQVDSSRSAMFEREVRGQVPRAGAVTMYGAPEIGHESPYPEEELKRYQSQPDMMALQAYPGPNKRREMALRAEHGSRAVTMYVQSPDSNPVKSRHPSQQGYRDDPTSGLTQAAQLELRKKRAASSSGTLQDYQSGLSAHDRPSAASAYANQHRQEFERGDDRRDGFMKQMPLAVWAGRPGDVGGQSAQSSPGPRTDQSMTGHARSGGTMFGRFGGSVTSFFGGSQGGVSGSMMDMHLGLENDRLYPQSSTQHPRSVSMASPARPRFFARPSRESLRGNSARPTLLNRIRSSSSVMELASITRSSTYDMESGPQEDVGAEPKAKKKGFKGFLQKLGGKSNRRKSSGSEVLGGSPRIPAREEDATLPLRPPPSLSFLVDSRVDRPLSTQHGRSPSGSSLSGIVAAATNEPGPNVSSSGGASHKEVETPQSAEFRSPWTPQHRSVSAPGIVNSASRTSLLSSSPTSSRYPYGGQDARAGPAPPNGQAPVGGGQRDSISSTFSGKQQQRGSGTPAGYAPDGNRVHDSAVEVLEQEGPRGWPDQSGLPPLQRQYREKAPSSVSNSSGTVLPVSLESPGFAGNPMYGPPVMVAADSGQSYGNHAPYGQPDRQKNLPPLPPGMRQGQSSPDGSPNSFDAFFGQPGRYTTSAQIAHHPQTGITHGRQVSAGQQSYRSSAGGQSSAASLSRSQVPGFRDREQQVDRDPSSDRQAKRTRSRFGLKGLFANGLNLNNKEDRGGDERPYDRSPSLEAGNRSDQFSSQQQDRPFPHRRVRGNTVDERYRQTYYQ